jgi:hypothetical protein
MLCPNCSKATEAGARFCGFCGMEQRVATPPQSAFGETLSGLATPDDVSAGSDVTVILPRRRATPPVAPATHGDSLPASQPAPPEGRFDKPPTHRLRIPAVKIGGAVVIVMIVVFVAVAFHANGPGTTPAKVAAAPAIATQQVPASTPAPPPAEEPDGRTPAAEAPNDAPTQAAITLDAPPIADTRNASEVTPQAEVPMQRPAATAKDAARRNKARAPAGATTQAPAPVESPPPQPVEVALPAALPVTPPAPVAPVKAETVACADSSNPFARELCLWQECAKPEYRSHAECARFSAPGAQR